jgi:hypothetical protein
MKVGAKESDVMVLPLDMCDYAAHHGNYNPFFQVSVPKYLPVPVYN